MSGFYRMHRGWLEHPVLGGEPMCKRAAWAWLIEEASWSHRRRDVKGQTIQLRRGQLTASVRFLAEAWGWHRAKVERFLGRLQTEAMIETATETGQTIITICNYERYQTAALEAETEGETLIETGARQQRDRSETNDKEGKERKKGTTLDLLDGQPIALNACNSTDPFETFWRAYPSRAPHSNPKKPAREKFERAVRRGADPTALVRGAEVYAEMVRRQRVDPQYVAQAKTWLSQERWTEQLRAPEPPPGGGASAPARAAGMQHGSPEWRQWRLDRGLSVDDEEEAA